MRRRVAPSVAAMFALSGFCVAVVAGILVGNPPDHVLMRALVALGFCFAAGAVAGNVAQRVVDTEIDAHRTRHPVVDAIELGDESVPSIEGGPDGEEPVMTI